MDENETLSVSASGLGHSQATGPRSAKRGVTGQGNRAVASAKGKEAKNAAAANRSASRNVGAAIVNLDDYKNEKGEVSTGIGAVTGQTARSSERTVSEVRKPGSNPANSNRQDSRKQESPKSSSKRTAGLTNLEKQTSPHRNPAARMESQKETAASIEEPVNHLTQWEIQQKINARKANATPSEPVKRSKSRGPKSPESKPKRK